MYYGCAMVYGPSRGKGKPWKKMKRSDRSSVIERRKYLISTSYEFKYTCGGFHREKYNNITRTCAFIVKYGDVVHLLYRPGARSTKN